MFINWYLQKILVNLKCFFHPQGVELKFRYFMCFILQNQKNNEFFLEARSNSKIKLTKIKRVYIYHGNNNGGNGYCGQNLR